MITQTITVEQPNPDQHLVLPLRNQEKAKLASTTEEKVIALVNSLMASPLFTEQLKRIKKWEAENLPAFKKLDTPDAKEEAADYLAFLYIDVIFKAKMSPQNQGKSKQIDPYKKSLEELLEPLLPTGTRPIDFIAAILPADQQVATFVGQVAIANYEHAVKLQELKECETAFNKALLAQHAQEKEHYDVLSTAAWEQAQQEHEKLLLLGKKVMEMQELEVVTQEIKETATVMHSADTSLKATLEDCQRTLNQRITR